VGLFGAYRSTKGKWQVIFAGAPPAAPGAKAGPSGYEHVYVQNLKPMRDQLDAMFGRGNWELAEGWMANHLYNLRPGGTFTMAGEVIDVNKYIRGIAEQVNMDAMEAAYKMKKPLLLTFPDGAPLVGNGRIVPIDDLPPAIMWKGDGTVPTMLRRELLRAQQFGYQAFFYRIKELNAVALFHSDDLSRFANQFVLHDLVPKWARAISYTHDRRAVSLITGLGLESVAPSVVGQLTQTPASRIVFASGPSALLGD
jgi:hypothetical protein